MRVPWRVAAPPPSQPPAPLPPLVLTVYFLPFIIPHVTLTHARTRSETRAGIDDSPYATPRHNTIGVWGNQ